MVVDVGANKSPLVSLIAGGLAGGIEATITYPFEFAKTRVQLHDTTPTRNPFTVIRTVITNEGLSSVYKGCSTLVAGTIVKDGIRFISFDSIREQFKDPTTGTLSPLRNLLAGMSAGVVASTFAVTPTERIKTALIDDARGERKFRGPWHATSTLIREHGLRRALYRGYVTTTLKQASTTAVRLGVYNILKDFQRVRNIQQTTALNFANGAVAGTIVVFVTQPFDTLKTRAQSVKGQRVVEAWNGVVGDYGWRGLWRGSTMRLGRTVLAGGILFTSYEWIAAIIRPVVEGKRGRRAVGAD